VTSMVGVLRVYDDGGSAAAAFLDILQQGPPLCLGKVGPTAAGRDSATYHAHAEGRSPRWSWATAGGRGDETFGVDGDGRLPERRHELAVAHEQARPGPGGLPHPQPGGVPERRRPGDADLRAEDLELLEDLPGAVPLDGGDGLSGRIDLGGDEAAVDLPVAGGDARNVDDASRPGDGVAPERARGAQEVKRRGGRGSSPG